MLYFEIGIDVEFVYCHWIRFIRVGKIHYYEAEAQFIYMNWSIFLLILLYFTERKMRKN